MIRTPMNSHYRTPTIIMTLAAACAAIITSCAPAPAAADSDTVTIRVSRAEAEACRAHPKGCRLMTPDDVVAVIDAVVEKNPAAFLSRTTRFSEGTPEACRRGATCFLVTEQQFDSAMLAAGRAGARTTAKSCGKEA